MSNVMSGPHPLDHTALNDIVTIPDCLPDITGMKIAFSKNLGYFQLADDVEREFMSSVDALAKAGAIIEEVSLSGLDEIIRLSHGAQEFLAHEFLQEALDNFPDIISDYVPELLKTALSFNSSDFRKSTLLAGEIWQSRLGPLFQEYEALLCPTVSSPLVPAENWQKQKITVNGHQLTDTEMTMTGLFNLYSRCPVLSVPAGMTNDALPCGLQIIGHPYDDVTVFQIGAALEKIRPWASTSDKWPSLSSMTST
tara:strand:- start:103 stop:861 length:759 start_codon:yes stop_codon:yes gene_type:complete